MLENYPNFLTTADCCEILLVEKHAIYKLIEAGELEAIRINERNWRITKDSLIYYTLRSSGLDIDKEETYDYI